MSVLDFDAVLSGYADTSRLDELRATEYAYLDEGGHTYLDYTGAGLAARSQIQAHERRLRGACFGNPHSENPTSAASTLLIEEARRAVLAFFNASPADYAVVFTQNATGACRLIGEAYPFGRKSSLVLTADNHNSVNGLRVFAEKRGAPVRYIPMAAPELRVRDEDIAAGLGLGEGRRKEPRGTAARRGGLFAYPAQSNFTGVQHPLEWVGRAQRAGYDVLLDAAAFAPANVVDLSVVKPEFAVVSWYKVFGYPTGVGCLLARHDALARLRRPWFSGGTIWGVSVQGGWHRLTDDESAFEDGTLNFLSIPDVTTGLEWISGVGVGLIHQRVSCLTRYLLDGLTEMRHCNGAPLVRVYGPRGPRARGGTIAFNFLDPRGNVVDERAVARDSSAAGISVRTGCFCNPGAGEYAFGLTRRDVRGNWWRAFLVREMHTVDDYLEVIGLPTGGAVRVSFGVASTLEDVQRFLDFAQRTYADRDQDCDGLAPRMHC